MQKNQLTRGIEQQLHMDSRYMALCVFVLHLRLWEQSLAVSVHMAPRAEFMLQGHSTTGIRNLRFLFPDENSQAQKKVKLEKDHKLKPATTSLEEKLPSQADLHDNKTSSGEHSTDVLWPAPAPAPAPAPPPPPSPPPPPPPPGEVTEMIPSEKKTTEENESPPDNKEESETKSKKSNTHSETKPKATIGCGGSHCEDLKKLVSACLRIPGDGALELSLLITYDGDTTVTVKVMAPKFLVADRSKISISRGKSETIQFTIGSKSTPGLMEFEAVENKMINVTTIHGDCQIMVPLEYLRSSMKLPQSQRYPLISLVTSAMLVYLLVFVLALAIVGAWLCHKFCRKKRAGGAVRYQQVEMSIPGQIAPKERVNEGTDGWDDVWDDDWEDAEAAKTSSRLIHNLSSRGMAGRRGNKDGWDNSWEY